MKYRFQKYRHFLAFSLLLDFLVALAIYKLVNAVAPQAAIGAAVMFVIAAQIAQWKVYCSKRAGTKQPPKSEQL